MADTRGYDRPEGKLIEATATVIVENLPPEKARELAIAIQRRSADFAANHQPAASCRKLREEVFRLLALRDEPGKPIRSLQEDQCICNQAFGANLSCPVHKEG